MKKIEAMLKNAVDQLPHPSPDKLKDSQPECIIMPLEGQRTKIKNSSHRHISAAMRHVLAACATVVMLFTGMGIALNSYSMVELDMDAGFRIISGPNEKVVSIKGLDTNGENTITGVSFSGMPLEDALGSIVGLMTKKGYFAGPDGIVMLSVSSVTTSKANVLSKAISSKLKTMLQSTQGCPTIVSQSLSFNPRLNQSALSFGMSAGHIALIERISEHGGAPDMEQLLKLTIHELIELADDLGIMDDDEAMSIYRGDGEFAPTEDDEERDEQDVEDDAELEPDAEMESDDITSKDDADDVGENEEGEDLEEDLESKADAAREAADKLADKLDSATDDD
ncbi:MAG: hypothetical protein RR232_04975 [Clostridia bacterium]